jgi:hypothetical protein
MLIFVFQADNCGDSSFVSLDISLFITDPRNLFGAGSSFDFPQVNISAILPCSCYFALSIASRLVLLYSQLCKHFELA